MLEQGEEVVAELVRFDGGDADTEVAVDVKNVFHELLKVGAFVLVATHVDTCQHDFLEAMGDDLAHVVVDVLGGSAGGSSPDHWDDAVGAEVVAAVMNLDETAGMESVEGGMVAEQVTVVAFGVAVAEAEVLVDDVE